MATNYNKTIWRDGDVITAEKMNNIENGIKGIESDVTTVFTEDMKQALLQLASKVTYIDDGGQDYYDDLYNAFYPITPPAELVSISAVYTQSEDVYTADSLNSLKTNLVVTALYDDQTTAIVTTYTLSGTLTEGTSVITVTYRGKTTTFNVIVAVQALYPLVNGSHTFSDNSVLTISNGNHVKYECKGTYTETTGNPLFNLSDITKLGTNINDANSIDNQSALFSISRNSDVVFAIENVTASNGNYELQFNMRNAGGNTAVFSSGLSVTGSSGEKTQTITSNKNVGCIYTFFRNCQENVTYEFDVSLTVNGDRYV